MTITQTRYFAENPEEAPKTAPESTETEQAEEIPMEGKKTQGKPIFEDLARAFFTGKQIKKEKRQEPEQAKEEAKEEKPEEAKEEAKELEEKPLHSNDILDEDSRQKLSNGEQVTLEKDFKRYRYNYIYFTTPYKGGVRIVYRIETYNPNEATLDYPFKPDDAPKVFGFMHGDNLYTDIAAINARYAEGIESKLQEMIPDEETARRRFAESDSISDYGRGRVNNASDYDVSESVRRHFYDGTRPELRLYADSRRITGMYTAIEYIINPDKLIADTATEYAQEHIAEITAEYITLNKTNAALDSLIADTGRPEHLIRRISAAVTDQKVVRVELVSGEEIRVEAQAIKSMRYGNTISRWYIVAADRDKLPRNHEITPEQIASIKYGQRTLYKAA